MTLSDATLISEIAHGIIAEVAPDELPMFGVVSRAFLTDPKLAAVGAGDDDEMLGFGGGAEVELLTPLVFSITSGVVAFLVTTVVNAAKSETQAIVQQRVRQLFKRFSAGTSPQTLPPLALSREQLAEVRRVAFDIASRTGLPAAQAALLADSTVGQLAISG
jgi:hypothetical protein